MVTRKRDIPVTNPAQTIADLRPIVSPAEMRRAVRQSEVAGLRTGLEPRRKKTRSELEEIFLTLCRRHRIPTPEVNVKIGRREVDDHERDLALRILDYEVVHLTYRQMTTKPKFCAAIVKKALNNV